MTELKLWYCKCCQRRTPQTVKSYYDGTVVMECLECRFRELTKKGYNYRTYERRIAREANFSECSI